MAMKSRERLLTAINNKKPDRLPAQVHSWMDYYLAAYLGGCDQYEAYARFGLDSVIYAYPDYIFSDADMAKWVVERVDLGIDANGDSHWAETITTPDGTLSRKGASNKITGWETEHLVKSEQDLEMFRKYFPVPCAVDFSPVTQARDKIGDNGIVRSSMWGYGQSGAWQSFCFLVGTERAIYWAMDCPEWVHNVLQSLINNQLRVIDLMKGIPLDLIETGGGAGSNTVISPAFHREFCVPYDRQMHDALHAIDLKVVYHLCGGVMQVLEDVVSNGADGLETMTPPGMGGDCNLAAANRRVGSKLFFVGGFDQNEGFTSSPERARQLVFECHAACPDGGYICSPSDAFFSGDPANVQAFADAVKECYY